MSLEGFGRSLSPETPPQEGRVTEKHQGIIDAMDGLRGRAEGAEHNELQAYRLLVPRLVAELNDANAQNENLQQMIRESAGGSDSPPAPEGP